jgi:hypothetical protein
MENALQWKPENINVCVCSFSEDRDSLSQWKAYGSRTSGFAIGFPADLLTSATKRKGWYLAPCVYEPAKQVEIIRLLVEEVLEEHLSGDYGFSAVEKDEEGISLRGSGGSLLAYLNRYAPILKDESFSEEKEWRVMSRPLINQSAGFSFREGQSLLIPYSNLRLSYEDMPFLLQEVVIGPTPERSRSSVTNFLVHKGVLKGLKLTFQSQAFHIRIGDKRPRGSPRICAEYASKAPSGEGRTIRAKILFESNSGRHVAGYTWPSDAYSRS